jgi:hypothetical protein
MNIAEILKSVEIVSTCTTDILTVHFLCIEQARDLNILAFREAVDTGALQITEVGEGTVPELCFNNTGNQPVFVPEGTIIENLMQNRFVRVSFIINGNTILNIPCACVEQSRWGYENNRMGNHSTYHVYPGLRAINSRALNRSLRLNQGYESYGMFQRETWNKIEDRLTSTKTDSRTRNLGDYYRDTKNQIDKLTRGIFIPDDVNGFIAMIEGKPIELTIMGSYQLFSSHAQGLMTGIAVECFEDFRKNLTYEQFMVAVSKANIETYPSVGAGSDMRIEDRRIVGSALVNQNQLIHLGVYANI